MMPPPEPYFGINNPPGAPEPGTHAPGAVVWFKVYAAINAIVYGLVFALGVFMMVVPGFDPTGSSSPELGPIVFGIIYGGMGLLFAVPYTIALFLRPKKWVYVFDLVLICIGLMSCACWPISIPLLIYWFNPDVRAYFGA